LSFPVSFTAFSSKSPYPCIGFEIEDYGTFDLGGGPSNPLFMIPSESGGPVTVEYWVIVYTTAGRIVSNHVTVEYLY
jgi:hypothetical protein